MRLNRKKKEAELREELEFHIDAETEERAAAGPSSNEARNAVPRHSWSGPEVRSRPHGRHPISRRAAHVDPLEALCQEQV